MKRIMLAVLMAGLLGACAGPQSKPGSKDTTAKQREQMRADDEARRQQRCREQGLDCRPGEAQEGSPGGLRIPGEIITVPTVPRPRL